MCVAKRRPEDGLRTLAELLGGQVLVRLLRPDASGPLIRRGSVEIDRAHGDFAGIPLRLKRLAQDEPLKRVAVQRLSEQ